MKTRDWLLNKVVEQDRTNQRLMVENRRLLDELVDERQAGQAPLRDLSADMEQKAEIAELQKRIAAMAPQKQFVVYVGHKKMAIQSVASMNGVTTLRVSRA